MNTKIPRKGATKVMCIAKYIIKICRNNMIKISNAKLQRLLYYVQAHYLVKYKKPAFAERIEAWKFGPVQPLVYKNYKIFGYNPIVEEVGEIHLPFSVLEITEEVIEKYGDTSAFQLHEDTTSEDPWLKARQGIDEMENTDKEISYEDMIEYFDEDQKGQSEGGDTSPRYISSSLRFLIVVLFLILSYVYHFVKIANLLNHDISFIVFS